MCVGRHAPFRAFPSKIRKTNPPTRTNVFANRRSYTSLFNYMFTSLCVPFTHNNRAREDTQRKKYFFVRKFFLAIFFILLFWVCIPLHFIRALYSLFYGVYRGFLSFGCICIINVYIAFMCPYIGCICVYIGVCVCIVVYIALYTFKKIMINCFVSLSFHLQSLVLCLGWF